MKALKLNGLGLYYAGRNLKTKKNLLPLDRLLNVCKSLGVKVVFTQPETPWDRLASYIPDEKKIIVEGRIDSSDVDIVLAHEIGHAITLTDADITAYSLFNVDSTYGPKVYQSEVNAWDAAEMMLSEIGFSGWDRFKIVKQECLKTYADDILAWRVRVGLLLMKAIKKVESWL